MKEELLKLALSENYEDGRNTLLSPIRFHAQRLSQFLTDYFTHYYVEEDLVPPLLQSLDSRLSRLKIQAGAVSELTLIASGLIQKDSAEIIELMDQKRHRLALSVTDEMQEAMSSLAEEFLKDFEAAGHGYDLLAEKLNEHFRQSVVFPASSDEEESKAMVIPLAKLRDKLFLRWSHDDFMKYLELVDELAELPAYPTFLKIAQEKYGPLALSSIELQELREEIEVSSLWKTYAKG